MKRRNFLGFLGGAAIAGPSAAKAAVSSVGMADLAPMGINMLGTSGVGGAPTLAWGGSTDNIGYAKDGLKKLVGMTKAERERRKRNHYFQGLDPDTASLRSISLTSKIRLAKDRSFEASERDQKTYLQGVIDRIWE